MRVRQLLQTLLNCDLDSQVEVIVNQEAVPLKHILQGGRSLTTYFGIGDVRQDSFRVDMLEMDRQPHPSLGLLLRAESLRIAQEKAAPHTKAAVRPKIKKRRKRSV